MSNKTQALKMLYPIYNDLSGTRYNVVPSEDFRLMRVLKDMCYERCPSLEDPVAKDFFNELKEFASTPHRFRDISNMIDVIETQFT